MSEKITDSGPNLSHVKTFTLGCCNRTPCSLSWHPSGLISHALSNCVSILERTNRDNYHILSVCAEHSARVNTVHWVRTIDKNTHILISGGVDKLVKVYTYNQEEGKLSVLRTYTNSQAPVITVCGAECNDGQIFIAASSGDSTVFIYDCQQETTECIQELKFGSGFALSLAFWTLPNSSVPILACGCDDMKIHLYALVNGKFEKVITLSGHEDWIRSVNFTTDDSGDVLLASSAQDNSVRIWRLSDELNTGDTTPDQEKTSLKKDFSRIEIEGKKNLFTVQQDQAHVYCLSSESVLYGHEGWVYSAQWHPPIHSGETTHQPLKLLTGSMDKTMIIWQPDPETGVWEEGVRVGEVGGNTLGLYGCQFSPDGNTIIAHGYQGAFTVWNLHKQDGHEDWRRGVVTGGHFSEVTDLCWDPHGEFILTTGLDQTTRMFAPWKKSPESDWYEMGRPQVHGYDIECITPLSRFSFVSGSDEKIVRVFRAPNNVLDNLEQLTNINLDHDRLSRAGEVEAEGASVPALGLSNKAVYTGTAGGDENKSLYSDREMLPSVNEQYSESAFRSIKLSAPPSEDNLLQNTLWPETNKLYGHGYELYSVASSSKSKLLASACKAAKLETAVIILWNTDTWQQLATLSPHTLTVVQMEFSNSGDLLLSVSRDRKWAVHNVSNRDDIKLLAMSDKATGGHTRIIWSCCWSFDDQFFCTASRDKKACVWAQADRENSDHPFTNKHQIIEQEGITAVSCAPVKTTTGRYIIAVGLETGEVKLYGYAVNSDSVLFHYFNKSESHHLMVKRLRFRPVIGEAGKQSDNKTLQLASCGSDHIIRIFNFTLS